MNAQNTPTHQKILASGTDAVLPSTKPAKETTTKPATKTKRKTAKAKHKTPPTVAPHKHKPPSHKIVEMTLPLFEEDSKLLDHYFKFTTAELGLNSEDKKERDNLKAKVMEFLVAQLRQMRDFSAWTKKHTKAAKKDSKK